MDIFCSNESELVNALWALDPFLDPTWWWCELADIQGS